MKVLFYIIIFCILFLSSLAIIAPPQKEILIPPPRKIQTQETPPLPITPEPITPTKVVPPPPKPAHIIIKKEIPPEPPPSPIVASPPVASLPRKQLSQDSIYKKGLESIVNFLCDQGDGKTTVATGVIISSNGYIATNAHIADDLKDVHPTCTVRRGSPAQNFDTARLVWSPKIYHATTSESVRATHDIAIWKLKQTTQTSFFDFDYETEPVPNETFLTLSYPAELLSAQIIFQSLSLAFSNTIVTDVGYSIIQSRATISAQHGSSGGVLIDPYTARIRGIIFGINKTESISNRILYALSPKGINKAILEDTQKTLTDFLAGNP
ncbi:MAG: serine protease [Patescibacteria group bacterium]